MKKLIISPSGNLYGSENVLLDYLLNTDFTFEVYVPNGTPLQNRFLEIGIKGIGFRSPSLLYAKLLLRIFLKEVDVVYCNEGGHFRYMQILAFLFPSCKFLLHVRMISDATRVSKKKWIIRNNFTFVCISKTVRNSLNLSSVLLYDGYEFDLLLPFKKNINYNRIGLIGRVTYTKGVALVLNLLDLLEKDKEFYFFGEISDDVLDDMNSGNVFNNDRLHFMGFTEDKKEIYSKVDIVVHLSDMEGLGRVFFESLNYGIPFLGLNCAGIAEIGNIINYPYLANSVEDLADFIRIGEINECTLHECREIAKDFFSVNLYTRDLDELLT
jgi:glycosyltransferase involved in cell wall biosynthesis